MEKVSTVMPDSAKSAKGHIAIKCVLLFFLFLALLLFSASIVYNVMFSDTGFDSVLFTLFSLKGAQGGSVWPFVVYSILPSILITAFVAYLAFGNAKWKAFKFVKRYCVCIMLILGAGLLIAAAANVDLFEYIYASTNESEIFEEEYIDPKSVNITFPEKKRNVVYILLESMETTFMSKEEGGALDYNTIPELYTLASENTNFSHNEGVGGFVTPKGATWTIAAITSQTSGIPLKTIGFKRNTYGGNTFLPGVTSITDVLKENGYYQAVMFGSDAAFANRDVYYNDHGADVIYDLFSAREDGIIPEDYKVWWGMEDKHLFQYAKEKLSEISKQEQPFAFTMLTVDTHHVAGYKCDLCGNEYDEQYENVYSCSSKQVYDFVEWLKQQDFYENTTIIISGDHFTMDSGYIKRNVDKDYEQHVYNCFINAPVTTDNSKNRDFCGMDMFPTTLAAMGCTIEGDRLGLGTNLFSDTPTLIEKMGYEEFDKEISRGSEFYMNNFLMVNEE